MRPRPSISMNGDIEEVFRPEMPVISEKVLEVAPAQIVSDVRWPAEAEDMEGRGRMELGGSIVMPEELLLVLTKIRSPWEVEEGRRDRELLLPWGEMEEDW